MSKRFVLLLLIMVFAAAPVGAKIYSDYTTGTTTASFRERTKQELLNAIKLDNASLNEDERYSFASIASFKRYDDKWYVLDVKMDKSDTNTVKMLLGDFDRSKEKMTIITRPGESLDRVNISLIGVPYDVIDKIAIPDGGHEGEEG